MPKRRTPPTPSSSSSSSYLSPSPRPPLPPVPSPRRPLLPPLPSPSPPSSTSHRSSSSPVPSPNPSLPQLTSPPSSSSSSSLSFPSPKPTLPPLPSPPYSSSPKPSLPPLPSPPSSWYFPSPKPSLLPLLSPSPSTSTVTSSPLISAAAASSSSSSSLSVTTKTAFYARVQFGHAGCGEISHHWYCLNDQKKKEDSLAPLFDAEPEPDTHRFSKSAVLGSRFYVMGGLEMLKHRPFVSSSDVFYLDTEHPGDGWRRGPSLLQFRSDPYIAVANGKLYVFGGNLLDENLPWGEYLDPIINQWQPLNPSLQIPTTVSAHALLEKDVLLIHTPYTRQLFKLNVGNGLCEVYNHPSKPFGNFWGGAALLDGFMFFARNELFAYDLQAKEWSNDAVEGLEDAFPPCLGFWALPPTLYSLGSRLGLAWGVRAGEKLNIKITTFGIKKEEVNAFGIKKRLVAHSLRQYDHLIEGTFMLDFLKS